MTCSGPRGGVSGSRRSSSVSGGGIDDVRIRGEACRALTSTASGSDDEQSRPFFADRSAAGNAVDAASCEDRTPAIGDCAFVTARSTLGHVSKRSTRLPGALAVPALTCSGDVSDYFRGCREQSTRCREPFMCVLTSLHVMRGAVWVTTRYGEGWCAESFRCWRSALDAGARRT
jgi:hypothetical protein